jgi:putative sigma-54 modulation protein
VHISGKDVFVECDDDNLYAAIDNLVDKLDRQVIKHKEKLSGRRHDESGKHDAVAE